MSNLAFDWSDPDAEPPNSFKVGEGVYASWWEGESHPMIWHWCPSEKSWKCAGTGAHDLVSRDPLHLEPSLLLSGCCGLHGFIRGGKWISV